MTDELQQRADATYDADKARDAKTAVEQAYALGKRERETQGPRDEPLSGEWADDFTVADLLNEIEYEGDGSDVDDILTAYEDGYHATDADAEDAAER